MSKITDAQIVTEMLTVAKRNSRKTSDYLLPWWSRRVVYMRRARRRGFEYDELLKVQARAKRLAHLHGIRLRVKPIRRVLGAAA